MELQTLINSIKAIAQWLKQRSQQSQGRDEGLKKWLDGSQEDLAAIDRMLAGGSNNAQGELESPFSWRPVLLMPAMAIWQMAAVPAA
jgi:hypothetical protein